MELEGSKDQWTKNIDDSNDTRWEYTYHGRFKNWGQWRGYDTDTTKTKIEVIKGYDIDQIEAVVTDIPHG
jgi:hypothetical protein